MHQRIRIIPRYSISAEQSRRLSVVPLHSICLQTAGRELYYGLVATPTHIYNPKHLLSSYNVLSRSRHLEFYLVASVIERAMVPLMWQKIDTAEKNNPLTLTLVVQDFYIDSIDEDLLRLFAARNVRIKIDASGLCDLLSIMPLLKCIDTLVEIKIGRNLDFDESLFQEIQRHSATLQSIRLEWQDINLERRILEAFPTTVNTSINIAQAFPDVDIDTLMMRYSGQLNGRLSCRLCAEDSLSYAAVDSEYHRFVQFIQTPGPAIKLLQLTIGQATYINAISAVLSSPRRIESLQIHYQHLPVDDEHRGLLPASPIDLVSSGNITHLTISGYYEFLRYINIGSLQSPRTTHMALKVQSIPTLTLAMIVRLNPQLESLQFEVDLLNNNNLLLFDQLGQHPHLCQLEVSVLNQGMQPLLNAISISPSISKVTLHSTQESPSVSIFTKSPTFAHCVTNDVDLYTKQARGYRLHRDKLWNSRHLPTSDGCKFEVTLVCRRWFEYVATVAVSTKAIVVPFQSPQARLHSFVVWGADDPKPEAEECRRINDQHIEHLTSPYNIYAHAKHLCLDLHQMLQLFNFGANKGAFISLVLSDRLLAKLSTVERLTIKLHGDCFGISTDYFLLRRLFELPGVAYNLECVAIKLNDLFVQLLEQIGHLQSIIFRELGYLKVNVNSSNAPLYVRIIDLILCHKDTLRSVHVGGLDESSAHRFVDIMPSLSAMTAVTLFPRSIDSSYMTKYLFNHVSLNTIATLNLSIHNTLMSDIVCKFLTAIEATGHGSLRDLALNVSSDETLPLIQRIMTSSVFKLIRIFFSFPTKETNMPLVPLVLAPQVRSLTIEEIKFRFFDTSTIIAPGLEVLELICNFDTLEQFHSIMTYLKTNPPIRTLYIRVECTMFGIDIPEDVIIQQLTEVIGAMKCLHTLRINISDILFSLAPVIKQSGSIQRIIWSPVGSHIKDELDQNFIVGFSPTFRYTTGQHLGAYEIYRT
eukprot:gene17342-20688_t